jgi:hypothetical protein
MTLNRGNLTPNREGHQFSDNTRLHQSCVLNKLGVEENADDSTE